MDRAKAQHIVRFLIERVASSANPRTDGAALKGFRYEGQWRNRVGDYRIIAEIKDDIVTLFVVEIGHLQEIYR